MTNPITTPIRFDPLNLETCRADPQWCKKEIVKRLMLLLLEYTRSKPLPFMAHIEPFGPGPTRPPVNPAPAAPVYTIYSNPTDGDCGMRGEATWPLARDPVVSEDCNTDADYYSYAVNALRIYGTWYCSRSWFDFDLSPISSGLSIVSATLRFRTDCIWSDTVCLQEGTQAIPMTVNDFQAFTGSILGQKVLDEGVNIIDFNSAGLLYLQSVFGSTAKICMREYDFDYLDIAPGDEGGHIGVYYSETPLEPDKPMLTITAG